MIPEERRRFRYVCCARFAECFANGSRARRARAAGVQVRAASVGESPFGFVDELRGGKMCHASVINFLRLLSA